MDNFDNFIKAMPKAELHVHVEGTLEPKLKFRFWTAFPGSPFAREWLSRLWSFENDNRRGKARRAPTNDVNGIPELRFG